MSAVSVGREIMLYYLDTLGGKIPAVLTAYLIVLQIQHGVE